MVGSGLEITAQRGDVTDRLSDLDVWIQSLYDEYEALNATLWTQLFAANTSLTQSVSAEAVRAIPIENSLSSWSMLVASMS